MQSQFSAVQQGTWPDGTTISPVSSIDYLVVAGGGGGVGPDGSHGGSGGGAGGYRSSGYGPAPLQAPDITLCTSTVYPVTVGAGGAAGTDGTDSVFNACGVEGITIIYSSRRR